MRGDIPAAAFRVLVNSNVRTHESSRQFSNGAYVNMREYMRNYKKRQKRKAAKK